ncbi:MAG: K+-dependent Na+/Ca+ exchanger related-protein [candidate division TM6 bacterium GW2011_GWF2_28_16]|nr:MAG: K+-dependent Na+/Ca+ exchanger related-protein [candidate division TM6 bacterium GW2011_GWF2_28_16]
MQNLIIYFFGLFLSLGFLWLAAELSVKYSIKVSEMFGIDKLFLGFTFVAVATGLPELSVAICGLFEGIPTFSVGTILGSNISDISLVLGLAILIYGVLKISKHNGKESLLMLIITTLSCSFIFIVGYLNKYIGLFLILVYFITVYFLFNISKNKPKNKVNLNFTLKEKIILIIKLLFSVGLVFVASEFAVKFSIIISRYLNISEHIIGVTILAIGTSLPELTLSLSAMRKKEYDIALGNSLGSVFEQGTLLIGIVALSSKDNISLKPLMSLIPYMFLPFLIILLAIIGRKKIGRLEACIMFLLFILFLAHQVFGF